MSKIEIDCFSWDRIKSWNQGKSATGGGHENVTSIFVEFLHSKPLPPLKSRKGDRCKWGHENVTSKRIVSACRRFRLCAWNGGRGFFQKTDVTFSCPLPVANFRKILRRSLLAFACILSAIFFFPSLDAFEPEMRFLSKNDAPIRRMRSLGQNKNSGVDLLQIYVTFRP